MGSQRTIKVILDFKESSDLPNGPYAEADMSAGMGAPVAGGGTTVYVGGMAAAMGGGARAYVTQGSTVNDVVNAVKRMLEQNTTPGFASNGGGMGSSVTTQMITTRTLVGVNFKGGPVDPNAALKSLNVKTGDSIDVVMNIATQMNTKVSFCLCTIC